MDFLDRIRQQSKRIGTRLMTLYLLLLLVPMVGIGIYGHRNIRNTLTDSALRSGLDDVTIRALSVDALLDQIHADILYLEQRIGLIALDESTPDMTPELDGLAVAHPIYRSIAQVNAEGQIVAGHLTASLRDWVDGPAFANLLELPANTIRFTALPPLQNNAEDTTARLIAGVRLRNDTLLLDISVPYLLQSISNNSGDDRWVLFIAPNTLLTLSDAIEFDNLALNRIANNSGWLSVGAAINLYHATGPGESWLLIHHVPRGDIVPDMTPYVATLFFIVLGGIIAVSGLALLAISYMITPVYQLEDMVEQVRNGVPRPPLPENVPTDEFGNLMLAFDHMAEELETKRRKEKALIEQLIRAQEEERKIVAYDLHDGLIQSLVGARFYLGQARGPAEACMGAQAEGILQGYEILTRAIAEGRRIMQGLQPTVLEDLGLAAALKELGKSIAETAGWQLQMDIADLHPEPDSTSSVILYRITQEALNNAFKHAQATRIWLQLAHVDGLLQLTVRDDGTGFDIDSVINNGNGGHGWGIRTMRERALMLHGACQVTSTLQTGTTIVVTIPYEEQMEPIQ